MRETDYVQAWPWMPPVEDVAVELVTVKKIKVYICDTCCKNPMTQQEKAEKDRRILEICARSQGKKLLRESRRGEACTGG